MGTNAGHSRLWSWFGIGRPSFCVMPRVMMHAMPDDWQSKMADLLEQFDEAFPGADIHTRVLRTESGKLVPWPAWLLNYRYPDKQEIEKARKSPWES